MKSVVFILCIGLSLNLGTAGCSSEGSGTDCIDEDGDGYGAGEDCLGSDCEDGDPGVHSGADEIPYDGQDNDCDSSTPDDDIDGDGYLSAVDCDDSDQDVNPGALEDCADEVDNDCNGDTDGDDDACDTCSGNFDCDDGKPCTSDFCVSGFCQYQDSPDGASCDDGLFCTVNDVCTSGNCAGVANDCDDGDACTQDSCSADYERCENVLQLQPGAEGTGQAGTCDNNLDDDCDGLTDLVDPNCHPCTQEADCDDDNDCTMDTCTNNECDNSPLSDGLACDDGQYCTVSETCLGGVCPPGVPRDCDDSEPCTIDACNEQTDGCENNWEYRPGQEGLLVDDTCENGQDDDCDMLTDSEDPNCIECNLDSDCHDFNDCTADLCREGRCVLEPVDDGLSCDDGTACTVDDACDSGWCTGIPKDCSDFANQCNRGICDESTGECLSDPLADGTQCEDGLFCTAGDSCLAGSCLGSERDCSHVDGDCAEGVCLEEEGQCIVLPANEGGPCDDLDPCTEPDTCQFGVCVGTWVGCYDPSILVTPSNFWILADGTSTADLIVEVFLNPGEPAGAGFTVSLSTTVGAFQENGSINLDADTDSQGKVYATLLGGLYEGTAFVTVSGVVEQIPVNAEIVIEVFALGAIRFVSAVPERLGVQGSGHNESSVITFELLDTHDMHLPAGALVEFDHSFAPGVAHDPPTAYTNQNGLASTTLYSGTTATTLTMDATATVGLTQLTATSPAIEIVGARPNAAYMAFACDLQNVGGMILDHVETNCTVSLADRYSNKIGFATNVSFRTEAGSITASATTAESGADMGTATVTNRTGNPRPVDVEPIVGEPWHTTQGIIHNPRDGMLTMMAYCQGEEEFTDINGNGEYDTGEPHIDLGEPFVDANDNGEYDAQDPFFIDTNNNFQYDGPNGVWDIDTLIWVETNMIWTGHMYRDIDASTILPDTFDIPKGGQELLNWRVADVNLNPLNSSATISVNVEGTGSLGITVPTLPFSVPDLLQGDWITGGGNAGTLVINGAPLDDPNPPEAGTITLEIVYRESPGEGDTLVENIVVNGTFQ